MEQVVRGREDGRWKQGSDRGQRTEDRRNGVTKVVGYRIQKTWNRC